MNCGESTDCRPSSEGALEKMSTMLMRVECNRLTVSCASRVVLTVNARREERERKRYNARACVAWRWGRKTMASMVEVRSESEIQDSRASKHKQQRQRELAACLSAKSVSPHAQSNSRPCERQTEGLIFYINKFRIS